MDKITIDRIMFAHPKIREALLEQYIEINSLLPKGVRLRFAYVYRSIAEQDALFKQRPKVTNAKGGQSIHNYGLAFDIVLLYDKDNNETFETASWEHNKYWMQVVNYFKSKGWEWGGDCKKFKDAPHFQQPYKWRDLAKLPTFIDNGIKYPKI
jgi:peptidoglycan L-alanyl-D-glutamate endopeptidase CwlK